MQPAIVSVVMPVHDDAGRIDAALRAIRAQTLAAFECIIVDDGSTDAGIVTAARHATEDERIRILTLPASGRAVACNHGLAAARCDYVAVLGADSTPPPDWLARQVEALAAQPDAGGIGDGTVAVLRRQAALRVGGYRRDAAPDESGDLCRRLGERYALLQPAAPRMRRRAATT